MLTMSLGTGVELQIHPRPGPQAPLPPRQMAPQLRSAPRLIGSGQVGTVLQVDPGNWSGLPAPDIALQWQSGGADIAGATDPHFTPAGPDDLVRLRCLVTARNFLGTASAFSEAITVTYAAPTALGGLPGAVFILGSGDQIMNAFPDFTGASLSFSIPDRFKVTIAAPDIEVIEPGLVAAPVLTGSGLIGAMLSLDPGQWSGMPTPDLAFQWLRDGTAIAGATTSGYVPVAADDRAALAVRVTARNAGGSLDATTAPLAIRYAAPVARGTLADRILTLGSAAASLEAAASFSGAGLAFAVSGGGAVIDASTGRISLPATRLRSAETVTVTASNSGGAASLGFRLSVVDIAPVSSGVVFADLSYGQNSGVKTFDAAAGFTGANLSYAIVTAVAGVAIDAATGLVSIATTALLAATVLTIRARNSGGSVERSLKVAVAGVAPTLTGTRIADQLNLIQGSAALNLAAAPAFAGPVAAYAITAGAGVTIDAATGVMRFAKTALQTAQTVTVRATNAFGFVETSFAMSVVAAQSAPVITGAPVVSGGTEAGSVLRVVDAAATGNPTPVITRQWYLAGVAIAGATGASYTTLAAQAGKVITARTIATNAAGSATSAASNAITVTAAQAVTTVTTVAQLQAAMLAAQGGDIIEVTGGLKPGDMTITTAYTKSPRITVRAQDMANPPIFQGTLQLSGWNGITFSGLHFVNPEPDVRDTWAPYALRLIGNCKNFTVIDCYFSDYFGSIDTRDAENAEIAYNTVENYRCDVFRMYQSNINVRVHHNKIWKSNVNLAWQKDANRHPDGCQLACTSTNQPTNGFTFEDNFVQTLQASNDLHGCFMLSERVSKNGAAFPTYAHKNITVRRNFFQGTNCQAIAFGAVQGVVVEQNKLVRAPGSAETDFYTPQVYFIDTCQNDDVTITNNAWPLISGMTALKYGPGETDKKTDGTAYNTKVIKSGNINVATGDPVGWADTDVAKGLVGQYAAR